MHQHNCFCFAKQERRSQIEQADEFVSLDLTSLVVALGDGCGEISIAWNHDECHVSLGSTSHQNRRGFFFAGSGSSGYSASFGSSFGSIGSSFGSIGSSGFSGSSAFFASSAEDAAAASNCSCICSKRLFTER